MITDVRPHGPWRGRFSLFCSRLRLFAAAALAALATVALVPTALAADTISVAPTPPSPSPTHWPQPWVRTVARRLPLSCRHPCRGQRRRRYRCPRLGTPPPIPPTLPTHPPPWPRPRRRRRSRRHHRHHRRCHDRCSRRTRAPLPPSNPSRVRLPPCLSRRSAPVAEVTVATPAATTLTVAAVRSSPRVPPTTRRRTINLARVRLGPAGFEARPPQARNFGGASADCNDILHAIRHSSAVRADPSRTPPDCCSAGPFLYALDERKNAGPRLTHSV